MDQKVTRVYITMLSNRDFFRIFYSDPHRRQESAFVDIAEIRIMGRA